MMPMIPILYRLRETDHNRRLMDRGPNRRCKRIDLPTFPHLIGIGGVLDTGTLVDQFLALVEGGEL